MAAPTGHPKWGGRRAGTPNRVNVDVRNRIEAEADPVGFLIKVVKGSKIRGENPSMAQRIRAAERLLAKVVPDLKAVEMSIEAEIVRCLDDAATKVPLPDAIDHHTRGQRVVRSGQPQGELFAAAEGRR